MSKTKAQIYLFTDGSVNPQSGEGFGAYLLLEKREFLSPELKKNYKIIVYTDCQNITGLQGRRSRFEKNNYMYRY